MGSSASVVAASLAVACELGCGMWGLGPWPGIELEPPALGAESVTAPSVKFHFLHLKLGTDLLSSCRKDGFVSTGTLDAERPWEDAVSS